MNLRPPLLNDDDVQCLIRLVTRIWYVLRSQTQRSHEDAPVKPPLVLANEEVAPFLVRILNRAWASFDISDLSDEEVMMLHGACQRAAKAFVEERGDLCLNDDESDDLN